MCPATALDNPKGKPPPSYQGQFGRVDGTAQHISPKDSTNLVVVDGVVAALLLFFLAPLARSRPQSSLEDVHSASAGHGVGGAGWGRPGAEWVGEVRWALASLLEPRLRASKTEWHRLPFSLCPSLPNRPP